MGAVEFDLVVVGYRSERFVRRVAEALRGAKRLRGLVFVDNAEVPTTLEAVAEEEWPIDPVCLSVPTNPGFGSGVNRGVSELNEGSPYVVIANPDLLVREEQILAVISELEEDEMRAVGGGQLVTSSGDPVSSARKFPTPRSLAARSVREEDFAAGSRAVDWICGAFMVWRREWFERVGGFDERFFLYFEDVDICRTVRQLGGTSWAVAGVEVIHDQGHGEKTSEFLRAVSRASKLKYARKWLGPTGVAGAHWGNAVERTRSLVKGVVR